MSMQQFYNEKSPVHILNSNSLHILHIAFQSEHKPMHNSTTFWYEHIV